MNSLIINLNRKIIKIQCVIFLLIITGEMQGNNGENGLCFYSHNVNRDQRTSLNLTPEKPFHFPKGFTIHFDFCIRSDATAFGYIFRMIGNNSINFDLLLSLNPLDEHEAFDREFLLVIENQTVIHFANHERLLIEPDKWIPVELTFNHAKGFIDVEINGLKRTAPYSFKKITDYQLIFGSNHIKTFATSDVPPMSIKDIRFFDFQKKPVYHWKLDRHAGEIVYDEIRQTCATVVNPIWEIDGYTKWKKIKSFHFPVQNRALPQIAWDKYNQRFFFADSSKIYTYRIENDEFDAIIPLTGVPFPVETNQLFFSRPSDMLISYEFTKDTLSHFDFQTGQWSFFSDDEYLPHYTHHSSCYDDVSQTIYTMGGYGFYRYSSLLQINHLNNGFQWSRYDLSGQIHPRYLASMGMYTDSLLLFFGGYGNKSGRQQESPYNFYDLYAVNRFTFQVTKIWEMEQPDNAFLNSNSLIPNGTGDLFYALTFFNNKYETSAMLREFRIDRPSCRILGDSIPFYFNDVQSFCNLYKPDDEKHLFALTSYIKNDEREIAVYSIAYPPLCFQDTMQAVKRKTPASYRRLIAILLFLFLSVPGFIYIKKRKKRVQHINPYATDNPSADVKTDEETPEPEADEQPVYPAIHLLGELKIINSMNENLVQQFTPTTKQLFLLLLLHTINKKGRILTEEIQNALWQHKDHESARNNRNVYINKLRLLLNSMKEIKIKTEKGQWYIQFDKNVYIDYEDVKSSIKTISRTAAVNKKELGDLLKKIRKGKLLPFNEFEWLDEYKSDYTDLIIEFLYSMSEKPEIKNDHVLLSVIADAILVQDNIDEKGIKIKCGALLKLGKQNQAVLAFKKFSDDYKKLLGEKSDIKWDDIFNPEV